MRGSERVRERGGEELRSLYTRRRRELKAKRKVRTVGIGKSGGIGKQKRKE